MATKPLTAEQLADAKRLRALLDREKKIKGLTQALVADACGWSTQGAVSQYALGKIALNLNAVIKLARALNATPAEISPSLAAALSPAKPDAASARSEDDQQTLEDVVELLRIYRRTPPTQRPGLLSAVREYSKIGPKRQRRRTGQQDQD